MKIKTIKYKRIKPVYKRIISFATALVVGLTCMPISEMSKTIESFSTSIRASAFDQATSREEPIGSPEALEAYSQNYDATHANDTLKITFGDSTTSSALENFVSIGTAEAPFDGKIVIDAGMTLNLPTTMFDYITDDVQIVDTSGNNAKLVLTKTVATQDEPLFAKHVVKSRTSGSPVEWNLQYSKYHDSFNNRDIVFSFAGFIGTMEDDSSVKLTYLTFDNWIDNSGSGTAHITATGNVGLVCRDMKKGACLEVDQIAATSGSSTNNFNVTSTSSGHAGGLVGSMGNGSKLILGADLVNPQADSTNISANSGYAGGIVGECNGGFIDIQCASYTVGQVISGSWCSGAIAGTYKTEITESGVTGDSGRYSISSDKVQINNTCKVNGNGHCGALFGEVVNDGDMTISGTNSVSVIHDSGDAPSFGGLIGTYQAVSLSDSLTVNISTGTITPNKNGGSAQQFGGVIGEVSNASYVKLDGLTVNATTASASVNFGGMIGKAADGFIELQGTNTISYSGLDTTKTFGGVVGDIQNGVLYLNGSTVFSGAQAVSNATNTSGQVAGYRNSALVFAADGWTMTRSSAQQTLDDVGSWGEIVRFSSSLSQDDILTINDTNGEDKDHYVTLKAAVTNIEDTKDFVKTALNIQLNDGQSTGVLRVENGASSTCTSSALLGSGSTISLKDNTVSIDLTGTGITGLTRDNEADHIEFCGTFDGNGGSIKLAVGEDYFAGSNSEGNGKIYRHAYIGLVGKTNGATIQEVKISDASMIRVNAIDAMHVGAMHVGNIIGQASGDLTLADNEICSGTTKAKIDTAGSGSEFGGLIGSIDSAGTVSINNCIFNGEISGSATDSNIGGYVGKILNSNTFGITVSNSTINGSLTAASGNRLGGMISVIDSSSSPSNGRKLNINDVTVGGLVMSAGGQSGGFLGHSWEKTDVEFKQSGTNGVTVNNSSSLSSGGDTAGLVHTATGYWKVNDGGIVLDSMTVTANSAQSFGLIVNKGIVTGSAIYLELAPAAFSVTKAGVGLTLNNVTVFDELVAYSSSGDISSSGQGVVSIATTDHALLKMGSSDTNTGSTYTHKTAFLDSHTALIDNPNTRYYYNLDAYRENPADDKQKLLIWSVDQYAHDTIKRYFNESTSIGTDSSSDLDMRGYSYYPVDLKGSLTINGTLKLWNTDFDTTENASEDKRASVDNAQHKFMHNSLLRNVTGKLTATIKLDGEVNKIGDYCGALVMGTVSSTASGSPATITISYLELAGINIGGTLGDYAPLLINNAGNNSTINISNVSNDSSSYSSMGAGSSSDPKYIATSLLGKIGSSEATAVKLTFSGIKLDGRNASGVTALSGLNTTYHSTGSLFSKATLVDTLEYRNDSGSFGVYNYTYAQDWGDGSRKVTYGAEIDTTIENAVDNGDGTYTSKQNMYTKGDSATDYYTRPDTDPVGTNAPYGLFGDNFVPYVSSAYVAGGTKHELRVNIRTSTFDGCGTYNHPYIITSNVDIENIAAIINGTFTTENFLIKVPKAVNSSVHSATWCEDTTDDYTYKSSNSASTWTAENGTISLGRDDLREYLAGAYYQIDRNLTSDIVLSTDFEGISNTVAGMNEKFVFRGVIDGKNKTIVNHTSKPLVVSSYGCVIKDLNIEVEPSTPKSIQYTSGVFKIADKGCDAYGGVIGQIFGGDNIIDNVSVKYTGTVVNRNNKAAHLVPIGGYVGVIVNGGLIFRNMNGLADNDQAGISSSNLAGFDDDATSSANKKWLYINPIIGRVLNGYAITESTSYKPFEDGTRLYSDGSTVYFDGSAFQTAQPGQSYSGQVGVTMRNGTKNYSIVDINKNDTNTLQMNGIADGSTITVSSAQALFIMSLITESGMGKSADGHYASVADLNPYAAYMSTHHGYYDEVGSSAVNTSGHDYYDRAQNDTNSGSTDTIPYLIKKYTPESSGTYPAFCIAGDASHYYNLELSGSDTTFYLPDSYRGLGALMFGVKKTMNTDYDTLFKDNVIFMYSLDGAEKAVSLNMNLFVYGVDNYPTIDGSSAGNYKTGFGLINNLQSNYNNIDARKFKDITLQGRVKFELIDNSTGEHAPYTAANVGKSNPAVAAVVGVPVAGSGSLYFHSIVLDSMELSGMCYAGGFVGAMNVGNTFTFDGCSADDLKVFAGGAAGGLIGYMRNNTAKVYADFADGDNNCKFGIISIISASQDSTFGDNGGAGAGGLIGYRRTGVGAAQISTDENLTVKNLTICNGTSVTTGGYIGYDKDGSSPNPNVIYSGGIIGNADQATVINLDNVNVENLNIYGACAGGIIGYHKGIGSKATISETSVTTDTTPKCEIKSTYNNASSACGGFIGKGDAPNASSICNSSLTGYTISGYQNVGGMVGHNTTSDLTTNNIEFNNFAISGTNNVGGMVGLLSAGMLKGYNILIKDQDLTSEGTVTNNGYIVGNNASTIKLAGFSRQGEIDTAKMVGSNESACNETYGTNGYVIFADYQNTANSAFDKFSNMLTRGINIGQITESNVSVSLTYKYVTDSSGAIDISKGDNGKIDENADAEAIEAFERSEGEDPVTTYSATSVTDMSVPGVYLYNTNQKWYYSNHINDKQAVDKVTSSYPKAVWYFEPYGDYYKLYTDKNGVRNYIKSGTTMNGSILAGIVLTEDPSLADIFELQNPNNQQHTSLTIGDTFFIKNRDDGRYLQHSGSGGNGLRYHTDHAANAKIKLENANITDARYFSETYSNVNISGTSVTIPDGETPISSGEANSVQASDYADICGGYSDGTHKLYYITETRSRDIVRQGDNASPYVTTSPCTNVTVNGSGDNISYQFLTGDGVSNTTYLNSAAQSIINDSLNSSNNKRYQNFRIESGNYDPEVPSDSSKNSLASKLRTNMLSIKSVGTNRSGTYNGEDFPVLVVNDLSTAHESVNNYLRLLTNTSYNFANGYSTGDTYIGSDRAIYNVDISRWLYDPSSGKFVKQSEAAALKCTPNYRFSITPSDIDSEKWQISLIDVQFYDPSDAPTFNADNTINKSGKIAYHLYVPVVVKKMLFYSFAVRPASTTTYKLDQYPESKANLIENLGNPITMKVTYTYNQSADAWAAAINGGESVLRNYNKVLEIKDFENTFPADAKLVMVDPNDQKDKYYFADFSNGANGVLTDQRADGEAMTYKIDLSSFSGFSPVDINDLMTISLDDSEGITKNLVFTTADDPNAIVQINDGGPYDGQKLKYDPNGSEKHSIKVSLKNYQNNIYYAQENYYISIFTKEEANSFYHYEVKSFGSSFGDPDYPSAMINDESSHLILGDLFKNSVTIAETNPNAKLTSNNNTIGAVLTSHIGFTDTARNKSIVTYINNPNVKIYQTFLLTLNKKDSASSNQRGILLEPTSIIPSGYKINDSVPSSGYSLSYNKTDTYIELLNSCNLKDMLIEAARAEGTDHTIKLEERVDLSYDPNSLYVQFPKSTEGTANKGTYMIGYSNISSTSTGGAASKASKNTEGRADPTMYYITDDTSIEFSYNVIANPVYVNDGNENYGQLGINGMELDQNNISSLSIRTAAYFNIQDYSSKSEANFAMITVKLFNKQDDYSSALNMSQYLNNFELIGKNDSVIVNTADDPATEDIVDPIIVDTSSANEYVYIIPLSKLQTVSQSGDDYYIPIYFNAYSGNNSNFEGKDFVYSNYKVLVTADLLKTQDPSSKLPNSYGYDHIIYTNAKIESEIIAR